MAVSFGFVIGLGGVTRIPFASFYVVALAAMLGPSLLFAVGLLSVYGVARAGAVAFVAWFQAGEIASQERFDTIRRLKPVAGYVDALVLGLAIGCWASESLRLLIDPGKGALWG